MPLRKRCGSKGQGTAGTFVYGICQVCVSCLPPRALVIVVITVYKVWSMQYGVFGASRRPHLDCGLDARRPAARPRPLSLSLSQFKAPFPPGSNICSFDAWVGIHKQLDLPPPEGLPRGYFMQRPHKSGFSTLGMIPDRLYYLYPVDM